MRYIYNILLLITFYATEIALILYMITYIVNVKVPIEWHYSKLYGNYYYVSAKVYELFFIIGSLKLMNGFIEHFFLPIFAIAMMRLINELCDIIGLFSISNEVSLSIEFFIF